MTEVDFEKAEAVTRYLRSKDVTISDVKAVSERLLDADSKVLPNLNLFLMELIVDRINDTKNPNFKKIKHDASVWHLFIKVWHNFSGAESKLKNGILRRLRLAEVAIDVLANSQDVELDTALMEVVGLMHNGGFFEASLDEAFNILRSLLTALKLDTSDQLRYKWVSTVISIIDTAGMNSSKITSKKFLNDFSTSILPQLLRVSVSGSLQAETTAEFKRLIRDLLLKETELPFLNSNIECATNVLGQDEVEPVTFLYDVVVRNISDTAVLQDIFTRLTDKVAGSRVILLQTLSKSSKTLTSEFLATSLERELSTTHENSLEVISSIVEIDLEAGYKFAPQIIDLMNQSKEKHELNLKIGSLLIESFIRAREFDSFYDLWMKSAATDSGIFSSDEFIAVLSKSFSNLSGSQIEHLLTEKVLPTLKLADTNSRYLIAVIPVINFAVASHDALKKRAIKKHFKDLLFMESNSLAKDKEFLQGFWELKYRLLCLFDDTDVEEVIDTDAVSELIIADGLASLKNKCSYVFHSLFKVREFHDYEIPATLKSAFIKLLKKSDSSELNFFFSRWLVIIDLCFTDEELKSVSDVLFVYEHSKESMWASLFDNYELYERDRLMKAVIQKLVELVQLKNPQGVYFECISKIPYQCYSKSGKVKVLDLLVEKALSSKSSEIQSWSLSIIAKLLELPTFKSTIEADIDTLFKLQELHMKFSQVATITDMIWRHHWAQSHETVHKKWANSLIDRLVKNLEKDDGETLKASHFITFAVLKNTEKNTFAELSAQFQTSMIALIRNSIDSVEKKKEEVSWVLDVTFDLDLGPEDASGTLGEAVKSIGSKTDVFNQQIFNVVTKLSAKRADQLVYLATLYVVLKPGNEEIDRGLSLYLKSLDETVFLQGFEVLLQSFADEECKGAEYLHLLKLFVGAAQQHHRTKADAGENRVLQFYIARTVSSILSLQISDGSEARLALDILKSILTEMGWSMTQHSFESVVAAAGKFTALAKIHDDASLYIGSTQIFSTVLLYHRHRLSSRHHLVVGVLTDLLELLFYKRQGGMRTGVSRSVGCAAAYQRLMGNLCEPGTLQQQGSAAGSNGSQLNPGSAILRKTLRQFCPVILTNYIFFHTRLQLEPALRDELVPGVYLLFDVLTQADLAAVNCALDLAGQNFFKALYEDYNRFGKWNDHGF